MQEISFWLNNVPRRIICDPERRLSKVIRQDLGLTGTKEGCGKGHCGTCAVILDGKVVMSCRLPVKKAHGGRITTIEGLGGLDNPHPLQLAFAKTGAIQCGFCTPGLIIRAKALLDVNPSPSRKEIAGAIQPHLCRCTGYQKVLEAVEMAAAKMRGVGVSLELSNGDLDILGKPVVRRDALQKAVGATLFADDLPVRDCGVIKLLRSPHHNARIVSLDTSAAQTRTGVLAVFTAVDVEGSNILRMAGDDQPLLCKDRVRMKGDPVAAVVASSEEAAREALDHIQVDYEPLPAVLTAEQALDPQAPAVHEGRPNSFYEQPIIHGDVEKAMSEAAVVVEGRYSTATVEHAYLENDAGVAYVDEKERLVIMSGSQNIHQHKKTIAGALGLELDQVRMVQTPTGGAFGGKLDVSVGGVLGLAAWKLKKPVRLSFSREETFAATTKRHPFDMRLKLGATSEGVLTGLEMDLMADTGAYMSFAKSVVTRGLVHGSGPYRIPNARLVGRAVYTNSATRGAMRGFGAPQTAFAIESALDELAAELGMDPLEIRVKNGFVPSDETICGQVLDDAQGLQECLETMRPHYQRALAHAGREDSPGRKRGVGLAAVWFGPGRSAPDQSEAWAELLPNGDLQVWIGSADMGQGSDTMFWQIAAQTMGYPLERVHLCTTDTDQTPDGNFSAGSRQTYVSGRTVEMAVSKMKKALQDSGSSSYQELKEKGLPTLYKAVHTTNTTKLDPEDGHGTPWETYSFGVQMAEVSVDLEKGKVTVDKITAVHDMGTVINSLNVEGQLHGGIAMGMGYALFEEYLYGETNSFAKYRLPRAKDMPPMEVIAVEIPREGGPYGASGTGEFADVPTAPAITNAIYHACGVRVRHLPVRAEALRRS